MLNRQFYSHAGPPPVLLLFSGEERCSPSHEFGGWRPYLLIHTILHGRGTFRWERKSWSLEAGDAFVTFPEENHLYRADAEDPWHYFWLALDRALVPYLNELGISQAEPVLRTERAEELYRLYRTLVPVRDFERNNRDLRQYASVYQILGDLLSHRTSRSGAESSDIRPDHVKTMRNFIRRYYQTPIAVRDVADYVHLERTYASRLFKSQCGKGIAEYIRDLRLEKSREYLEEGFSVKQAAYSAGFQIYENFLKLFKKVYGETPGAYRKRVQT